MRDRWILSCSVRREGGSPAHGGRGWRAGELELASINTEEEHCGGNA